MDCVCFSIQFGYHVDETKGIAKGNDEESIYAVMSGTHFNGRWCVCHSVNNLPTTIVSPTLC